MGVSHTSTYRPASFTGVTGVMCGLYQNMFNSASVVGHMGHSQLVSNTKKKKKKKKKKKPKKKKQKIKTKQKKKKQKRKKKENKKKKKRK